MPALLIAVLFSGAASLMYQVAWTRRLVTATSATVIAQALILAVFMAGLGLGAHLAGRKSRRVSRPLLAYAKVEGVALLFAIVSIPIIGRSDALRTGLAAAGLSLNTGLWLQLLLLALFLLLPCVCLGASLPFLIEHLDRTRPDQSPTAKGRQIAALYGVNTLGAAFGCLISGFGTVEAVGLLATTVCGAALAAAACAIATAIAMSSKTSTVPPDVDQAPPKLEGVLLWVAAISGFVGLGAEVLWTRLVSLVVLNTVYAFSQVLAFVLIGIAIGASLAALITRRASDDPAQKVMTAGAQAFVLAAIILGLVPLFVVSVGADPSFENVLAEGFSLKGALFLGAMIVPPSALIATALPLVVVAARQARFGGARAFGGLYAANTLGSVAGSLAAGFLLLPVLGMTLAMVVVQLVALIGAVLLLRAAGQLKAQRLLLLLGSVTALLLSLSIDMPRQLYEQRVGEGAKILEFYEGSQSDVMVTEEPGARRRIWINSAWVATSGASEHGLLGHLPALLVESPKSALGIALGTGQTFSAVLTHGPDALHCVELNEGIIALSTRWFKEANNHLFEQPNVHLHHNDGRAYMRATDQRFDMIVLEPLQAWTAGTSNLYSKEFYQEAKAVLRPGGVIAQWIPFYGQSPSSTRVMVKAGLEVFDQASLWLSGHDGIVIFHGGKFAPSIEALRLRMQRRKLAAWLERDGRPIISRASDLAPNIEARALDADFFSIFLAGPKGLRAWVQEEPVLVDDHPFLEFEAARTIGENHYGEIVRGLQPHLENLSDYAVDTSTKTAAALAQAAEVRRAMLAYSQLPKSAREARVKVLEAALDATPTSASVRFMYKENILRWALAVGGSDPSAPERIYRRALERAPDLGEIALNLGVLLARSGRTEEARAQFLRAAQIPRVRPMAERALRTLGPKPVP